MSISDLRKVWQEQIRFNSKILNDSKIDLFDLDMKDKTYLTKQYILEMISEISELMDEINFKQLAISHEKYNESNIKEQLIDIFKYWLSLGLVWKLTEEDFLNAFFEKSAVVEERYIQSKHSINKDQNKIAIIDIDGVIATYPESFIRFLYERGYTGVYDIEYSSLNLKVELKEIIDPLQYSSLKEEYRTKGHERHTMVYDFIKNFLEKLSDANYYIVLMTARPSHKYKNLERDTYAFLKSKQIKYHAVVWDYKKDERILSRYRNLKFIIEDDPVYSLKIASLGYKVYLIDKPYNKSVTHKNIHRINHKQLEDIDV